MILSIFLLFTNVDSIGCQPCEVNRKIITAFLKELQRNRTFVFNSDTLLLHHKGDKIDSSLYTTTVGLSSSKVSIFVHDRSIAHMYIDTVICNPNKAEKLADVNSKYILIEYHTNYLGAPIANYRGFIILDYITQEVFDYIFIGPIRH